MDVGFRLLQININGLRGKLDNLVHYMEKERVLVAAVQETLLSEGASLRAPPRYSIIRADRPARRGRGGGLAFIVNKAVQVKVFPLPVPAGDEHLEQQGLEVAMDGSSIKVLNFYVPPASSCSPGYAPSIDHLLGLGGDLIVAGDANAHHEAWFSALGRDARGCRFAQEIEDSTLAVLNEDAPTRVTSTTVSSPDITLASAGLLMAAEWSTRAALGSDHLAVHVDLLCGLTKVAAAGRVYTNFRKADWAAFKSESEDLFARHPAPMDVHDGERRLRHIIGTAARHNIPSGCFRELRPFFPAEAAALAEERDRLQADSPGHQDITKLNADISRAVREYKRRKWQEHLDEVGQGGDTRSLWRTIKDLSGHGRPEENRPVEFGGVPAWEPRKAAQLFNEQFAPRPAHPRVREGRRTRRFIRRLRAEEEPVTVEEVTRAIKGAKTSKALGPDGLAAVHLKNLGTCGLLFLTEVVNLSLATTVVPAMWKVGRVIPALKPNKPATAARSYRPITLLSPVAKVAESVLLRRVGDLFPVAEHQHGFRKGRSTVTALNKIVHQISTGLNRPKPCDRTVLVALDLTSAFDTVIHDVLLEDVHLSPLPAMAKKWLAAYLRGRSAYVEFRGVRSGRRKVTQGVPQGGVLSPALFNLYMSALPPPPPDIQVVSYADDITTITTGKSVGELCAKTNSYLRHLNDWLVGRGLILSAEKSTASLFTTWTKEVNRQLDIQVAGKPLPTTTEAKVLGVTLDPLLTFCRHAANIRAKVTQRNNILKALAGTAWGCSKEVMLSTYKSIGRAVANYAAPVWSPQLSDSRWQDLQVGQNTAIRLATGLHKMSSVPHLHHEARLLPVKEHNYMLAEQFFLGAHLPTRPDHNTAAPPPARSRSIRATLYSRFAADLAALVPESQRNMTEKEYRAGLRTIHRRAARTAANSYSSPIWSAGTSTAASPIISGEEKKLGRATRSTLAQLRSGYSVQLCSYQSRLDPSIPDECPECGEPGHTTIHLFQCPANPTNLTPASLWDDPVEAARFLGLDCEPEDEDQESFVSAEDDDPPDPGGGGSSDDED